MTVVARNRTEPLTIERLEPSRAWILGLLVEPDGSLAGPGLVSPPAWPEGECECPHDCRLDHENA